MNKLIPSLTIAILLASPIAACAQNNVESDPGYLDIDKAIDLKAVHPEVNVNLPRFLLKDAAASLSGGPEDPLAGTGINFGDLVKDVRLIRVVVIEAGKTNRAVLEKGIKALRADLDTKWTAIVEVPEENVGVYFRTNDNGESMAGLAVLVYDDGDAVIANIVGQVSVGRLVKVASRFNFNKLPKDLLKKLTGAIPAAEEKSEPAAEKAPPAAK